MDTTIELTDKVIRDKLIEHKVITKERVKKCGSWMNKKTGMLKLIGQYPDILLDEDFKRIDWEYIYVNRKYMKLF